MYDYSDTVTAGPFGWLIRHTREGYVADQIGWLRMGESNAVDGYLLWEIPKKTMEEDLTLIGTFATFGQASWRFV
jgi:hypothetical protein